MDFTGKPMKTAVYVSPEVTADDGRSRAGSRPPRLPSSPPRAGRRPRAGNRPMALTARSPPPSTARPCSATTWTPDARDADRIASFFSEDATYDDRGAGEVARGPAAIRADAARLHAALRPALRAGPLGPTARGFSAGEWRSRMTDSGAIDGLRRPAGFESAGVDVATLDAEGRITDLVSYYDGAEIMRDLAVLPARGSRAERARRGWRRCRRAYAAVSDPGKPARPGQPCNSWGLGDRGVDLAADPARLGDELGHDPDRGRGPARRDLVGGVGGFVLERVEVGDDLVV